MALFTDPIHPNTMRPKCPFPHSKDHLGKPASCLIWTFTQPPMMEVVVTVPSNSEEGKYVAAWHAPMPIGTASDHLTNCRALGEALAPMSTIMKKYGGVVVFKHAFFGTHFTVSFEPGSPGTYSFMAPIEIPPNILDAMAKRLYSDGAAFSFHMDWIRIK